MEKYDGLMKYNKLIRDKIPEKIKANGESCTTHTANDNEYKEKLREKINEEVNEFLNNPSIEELADIAEVIYTIADFEFGGKDKLEQTRIEKFKKRGGFEKRLILDETDNT